jgi:hypothetical protein
MEFSDFALIFSLIIFALSCWHSNLILLKREQENQATGDQKGINKRSDFKSECYEMRRYGQNQKTTPRTRTTYKT